MPDLEYIFKDLYSENMIIVWKVEANRELIYIFFKKFSYVMFQNHTWLHVKFTCEIHVITVKCKTVSLQSVFIPNSFLMKTA